MAKELLNDLVETYAVALYDMDIIDVKERNERKIIFDTAIKAANFLGYIPKKFYSRIGIGKYAYHAETNKKYAVRKLGNPFKLKPTL